MFSHFHRITKAAVFIICVFLAVIFTSLAFPTFERVHWYRQIIMTLSEPPQKVLSWMGNSVTDIWRHYISLVDASKENDLIKVQLAEANRKLIECEEIKKENTNLHELLAMSATLKLNGTGAHVVASNVLAEFKVLTIDKGYKDGIRKNMVVIGPGGIVGRIGQVASGEATVLLISDPNSAVDVLVQRSGARAILVGTSTSSELKPFFSLSRLEYLRKTSDIKNGDVIITSGLDKLFPPGVPVGTANNVELTTTNIFKAADVVPFVDLSQVRDVFVLK